MGKHFSIVAVAEGAMSVKDAAAFQSADDQKQRAKNKEERKKAKGLLAEWQERHSGNTLRLAKQLEELTGLESRVTILGYVQRGGRRRRWIAFWQHSLGSACANLINDGVGGVMVAVRGEGAEPVPLETVAGKRKVVPRHHPRIHSACWWGRVWETDEFLIKVSPTSAGSMNVHHLELFYYVARHGGIMPAVRNIPYGIQQPAVSSQILQLEEFLGTTLFQRRPFALTAEGEKLFQFIQPFFSNLDKVASELQGGRARSVRIGAAAIVLRDYLPEIFQAASKRFPGLKLSLREGFPAQLEEMLQRDEIDLANTLLGRKPGAGIQTLKLLEMPMVLLAPKTSALKSADELWRRDKIAEPLICLPAAESPTREFLEELQKRGVDWFPGIEASSLEMMEVYVANGLGIGVSVAIPGKTPDARTLALAGFPPMVIGAMRRGRKTPLIETFLNEMQRRAKKLG